jgi:multimeric flavodoxin WrbA
MRVLAINGSPRKKGNTSILLETVLEELRREGIETEVYQLGGRRVQGCLSCYKCFERRDGRCSTEDDVINGCIERMAAADGILLGSPTYFCNVSTELKALIDRAGMVALANDALLRRKVGAAVVAVRRAGAAHAFSSINYFFTISQMVVPGSSYWNLGVGHAPGDVARDEEGLQTARTLGRNMAWVLEGLCGGSGGRPGSGRRAGGTRGAGARADRAAAGAGAFSAGMGRGSRRWTTAESSSHRRGSRRRGSRRRGSCRRPGRGRGRGPRR